MAVVCSLKLGEESKGLIANPKTFSTGSVGFYGVEKLTFGGVRYQVNVQLVKIGSKPDGLAQTVARTKAKK